jgi:hypothetical protein
MDECAIVGYGVAEGTMDDIARLRRDPGPGRPKAMEFQLLKHADEHTVLALAAMLNGLAGLPHTDYRDWGVVAAPRWPGRFGTANALDRHHADGPRGVSPMTIPTVCLHSMSGTVSLAFGLRGPNFGVGGGMASVADGLLAGLAVQLEQQPPGTWVLLSEWDIEPGQCNAPNTPRACALALALRPVSQGPFSPRLCLRPTTKPPNGRAPLVSLTRYLADRVSAALPWTCALDWGKELLVTEGHGRA